MLSCTYIWSRNFRDSNVSFYGLVTVKVCRGWGEGAEGKNWVGRVGRLQRVVLEHVVWRLLGWGCVGAPLSPPVVCCSRLCALPLPAGILCSHTLFDHLPVSLRSPAVFRHSMFPLPLWPSMCC